MLTKSDDEADGMITLNIIQIKVIQAWCDDVICIGIISASDIKWKDHRMTMMEVNVDYKSGENVSHALCLIKKSISSGIKSFIGDMFTLAKQPKDICRSTKAGKLQCIHRRAIFDNNSCAIWAFPIKPIYNIHEAVRGSSKTNHVKREWARFLSFKSCRKNYPVHNLSLASAGFILTVQMT